MPTSAVPAAWRRALCGCALALLLAAPAGRAQTASADASTTDTGFVNAWITVLVERVRGESVTPPVAARVFAYAAVAVHEGLAVPGDATSLAPGLRPGLELPAPDPAARYDPPTAASAAVHTVASELMREHGDTWQPFSAAALETRRALSALHRAQIDARRAEVEDDVLLASLELGAQLGRAVLGWAAEDGFGEARSAMFASHAELRAARRDDPSLWQSRASGRPAIEPFWGTLTPLVLPSADACHVPLGMDFDLGPGSPFRAQLMEVYELSLDLSEDEIAQAFFWDDEPVETGTIGGHFLMLGASTSERSGMTPVEAARLHALLATALHDAFVSAWWSKYEVMLVRPETLIREHVDPDWRPLLQTPNFPEYPSGHAVAGGAAAEVLTDAFGEIAFDDPYGVRNERGGFAAHDQEAMTRSFRSFRHAAEENALSRLYGGVHYRVAAEHGLDQGACVGQRVLSALTEGTSATGGR